MAHITNKLLYYVITIIYYISLLTIGLKLAIIIPLNFPIMEILSTIIFGINLIIFFCCLTLFNIVDYFKQYVYSLIAIFTLFYIPGEQYKGFWIAAILYVIIIFALTFSIYKKIISYFEESEELL